MKKDLPLTEKFFGLLCSLKLAVMVILTLAASLATGTVLESLYDTPTAQYYVYRSHWFHLVLAMLGINIFCVAVSRWPWKPRHIPFLLAHAGILMVLGGSWATEQFGLDGSLRVSEGESASVVEMEINSLVLTEAKQMRKIPVKWLPPGVAFKPVSTLAQGMPYDLTIDRFLSHADPVYSFIPDPAPRAEHPIRPAVRMTLTGGPMGITQDVWLWTGDPSFRSMQMGPAQFTIGSDPPAPVKGRPSLAFIPEKDGSLSFKAQNSEGKLTAGRLAANQIKGHVLEPGWKGGMKITLTEWVPNAIVFTSYRAARIQYGQQAPSSAIHVNSGKGGEGAETWLGLGDRAILHTSTGNIEIGYLPQRVVLPFAVRLDHFQIERYEGSMDPASYSSRVSVLGGGPGTKPDQATEQAVISMNEPLTIKGITLYQASYEDAQPRPTISIFSVNRDPGRIWKYLGSLLLVGGSITLFAVKYRKSKVAVNPAPSAPEVT